MIKNTQKKDEKINAQCGRLHKTYIIVKKLLKDQQYVLEMFCFLMR